MTATKFWPAILPEVPRADWLAQIAQIAVEADGRRVKADYNTGSILEREAYLLCALATAISAGIVLEVGTFIGTSTLALAMGLSVRAVYTCDGSNDCLPATAVVRTYPHTSSTSMLRDLRAKGVKADLCFFDGVLRELDVDLLRGLIHSDTVFAFHDYNHGPKIRANGAHEIVPRKGIGNVNLLRPYLPHHVLVEPEPETTLALLVPEARL
jgi:predicted O-methyltransferase YrrM